MIRRAFNISVITLLVSFSSHVLAQETRDLDTPAAAMQAGAVAVDDAALTAKVKINIMKDKAARNNNVSVTTEHGVVTLSGTVDSNSQATAIVQAAQSTTGVRDVDANHLMVKDSAEPMADAFITAKIKGLFIQEKLFGNKDISAMTISVETKDGTVYLTGTADNQAQIDNASKIAKMVNGVKEVISTVKINTTKTSKRH